MRVYKVKYVDFSGIEPVTIEVWLKAKTALHAREAMGDCIILLCRLVSQFDYLTK